MTDKLKMDIIKELSKGNVKINQLILEVNGNNNYYEGHEKEEPAHVETPKPAKEAIIDYVDRLLPVVNSDFKNQYSNIWKDILEQDAISKVVYERGSQKGTLFNRNLVAQISHMMVMVGVIIKETTDVRMAELLEPEKGKNHPVRGALALSPDDKQIKKAVNEVLEKHGVKVL